MISDPHGNVYGLRAALDAIKTHGVVEVLCAGDIVGYYPFVNETIDLVRAEQIPCVMGNHDAILAKKLLVSDKKRREYALDYAASIITPDNLEWLRNLPESLRRTVDHVGIEIYHGSPWQPLTEYIYPDDADFERFRQIPADFVVLGHTHWPFSKQIGDVAVVNPGSCGQPRDYQPGACFALLDTCSRQISLHRSQYDARHVVEKIRALNFDPKLTDILFRRR